MKPIKVYLSNKIFIKLSQLERHQREFIIGKYKFTYSDYCAFNKKYVTKTLNLFELVVWTNQEKWVGLPPNKEYFEEVMSELGLEFTLVDKRVVPSIEYPNVNIQPRPNQKAWLDDLEKVDYNALMQLPTGSGKTALSIYIASILKTPMIFVAGKTSYLESYKKEVFQFVDNAEDNYISLDSDWFKQDNPTIKPYMSVSIQTLSRNIEELEKLKDKIGLVVFDEIHSGMFSTEYRKAVYSFNTRYKLYLSATPKIKSFEIVNCMVSSNIISDDTKIDFDIKYQPVVMELGQHIQNQVKMMERFDEKKSLVFGLERLHYSVLDLTSFSVNNQRGVIVYSTSNHFQESVSRLLNERGVSNIIFNKDTKKSQYEQYLKDFDSGLISVIIGGSAVVEALSLYRLSLIIDCDLSLSENSIVQLIGRLKRKNDKICSKEKVYIKLIYKNINERKFNLSVKPILKTMPYVRVLQPKSTDDYNLVKLFQT